MKYLEPNKGKKRGGTWEGLSTVYPLLNQGSPEWTRLLGLRTQSHSTALEVPLSVHNGFVQNRIGAAFNEKTSH